MAVTLSYNTSNQYESDVMRVYLRVTIGASGAVDAAYGGGVTSVVKESTAGQYSITLGDRFSRILAVQVTSVDDAAPAWACATVLEDPALIQSEFAADSTFVLQLYNGSFSATNATSGSQLWIEITVASGNSPYDTYDFAP